MDIILLVQTWEHDTRMVQGLGNYNVHSFIWVDKSKATKRRRGGMFDKGGFEKYGLIIKNYEHKCYIWLKIEISNGMPTFVV